MGITRFEDIHAWQVARELCKSIYSHSYDGAFAKDYGLRDQTRRAVTSVMANIAEGFDCRSHSEFVQFLFYALRSTSEVQSHLYVAYDQGYVSQAEFARLYQEASRVKSMLLRFVEHLRTHAKP